MKANTMDVNEQNLQIIATNLQQTLSPDTSQRKPAEKNLESMETSKGYPVILLHLMDKDGLDTAVRISAAIAFKNFVKRCWRVTEESDDLIHADDRDVIKKTIVSLMLKSPEQIQRQLSDAISIIGREDFPDKWPNLIEDMVDRFKSGDFHVINGVLRTAHSIFKRYRHEFKSQELWKEIKFVLTKFAEPLTQLFQATMDFASKNAADPNALKVLFSSLVLICKIFYSLNFQDLPEYFEDNMNSWMTHFHQLLIVNHDLLKTSDESEAGLLEQVKSQVCDNVGLYAQKYDEEFAPHLPKFVEAIWQLLVTTGQEPKYDLLVSNAIQFLASVAERPRNKDLFADEKTLAGICENVILPNMNFRQSDEELFEDNAEEYIRRDIEGSDVDTRRRAACDLVKALARLFEVPVIQNFSRYVETMLAEYAKNPAASWRNKDVAIYLVTSLAAKGQTQKHGITQTSELVNITDFFNTQILPDLQSPNVNENPVIKADCIKYLMTFRSQLPVETLVNSIPLLAHHLRSSSVVVHSYAAHTIERLFTVRNAQGGAAISKEAVHGCREELLKNMFGALEHEGSHENEYVMKAIMRTFSLLQEDIIAYIPLLMPKLAEKLMQVSKNPSKPHFNHYLFETLCVAIRSTCKAQPDAVTSFEGSLFPAFEQILTNDVQEFMPYVFQVMSILLEIHSDQVPEMYLLILPFLLAPVLWERPGNIPPLVRLLQAFIQKGAKQIPDDKISGLLGVFQKLIASKSNDHEGFYLLSSMVEFMDKDRLGAHIKQVFVLLFTRLSSSKTTKFIKSLLVFFSLYMVKHGTDTFIQLVNSIQPNLFSMVLERIYILDVQKVAGATERKICAVGMTRLLTDTPSMMTPPLDKFWVGLLQALVGLFELPQDDTVPDDEHFIEIEDTPGYQTAYSKLMFAGKNVHDPLADIPDAKLHLAQSLHRLSGSCPGKLAPMISAGLPPEVAKYLQAYLTQANVTLL